jgi:hypothetical protein
VSHQVRSSVRGSGDQRNTRAKCLVWCPEAQGLSRSPVQLINDGIEIGLAVVTHADPAWATQAGQVGTGAVRSRTATARRRDIGGQ